METFLKIRSLKLANNYGLLYTLLLEPSLIACIILEQQISSYYLIIYMFIPFLFMFTKNKHINSYGYHIQRAIFITLCMILERRKIMLFFYTLIILLVYIMTSDLANYKPTYSIVVFSLMYLLKLVVYYMCFKASKDMKDNKEFETYQPFNKTI